MFSALCIYTIFDHLNEYTFWCLGIFKVEEEKLPPISKSELFLTSEVP